MPVPVPVPVAMTMPVLLTMTVVVMVVAIRNMFVGMVHERTLGGLSFRRKSIFILNKTMYCDSLLEFRDRMRRNMLKY